MHAGVVQSSGLHVKGSARGGTASSSGRSWAHACLSGSGRSCYSGPCREPDIGSLRLNRRQPAACSLRARDIAHPASALHQLSSECRRGAFGRNPSKCSQQRSRERHHAACAAAGAGGRLGGTWQPQHPGPGWWTWLTLRLPLLGSPQLLQRIALTILFLALARLGMFIPLPGVGLSKAAEGAAALGDDIFGLTNSIYQLGIGPYIDASWTLSAILLLKVPQELYAHLQSLRRAGREGHAVIKMYTQLGSLVFAVVLGAKRAVELAPVQAARGFVTRTMLTLVAGAMLLRFVADQNQDYGLGDGIALIICAGMASAYGATFSRLPELAAAARAPQWALAAVAAGCLALVFASVYVTQVEKRLPLVYYKRHARVAPQEAGDSWARPSSGLPPTPQRTLDYMPVRLTPSGMGPLLMASFVYHMLPQIVAGWSPAAAAALTGVMFNPSVLPWSFGAFVLLTMLLDFSGSSQAREMADWMSAVDAGVKGVSPGAHTEEFLASLQRLMRVWAGLAVAGLAVAAHLFDAACARHLGFSLNSIMLIMITGYVTTALRQAQSLMQLPRLARALAKERMLLATERAPVPEDAGLAIVQSH